MTTRSTPLPYWDFNNQFQSSFLSMSTPLETSIRKDSINIFTFGNDSILSTVLSSIIESALCCNSVFQRKIELPSPIHLNSISYWVEFVDEEGCFSVSFKEFKCLKLGIKVTSTFSIGQKKTNVNHELLAQIPKKFKGGAIRVDRYGKGMYKYETRSLDHIRKHIIFFLERLPLQK